MPLLCLVFCWAEMFLCRWKCSSCQCGCQPFHQFSIFLLSSTALSWHPNWPHGLPQIFSMCDQYRFESSISSQEYRTFFWKFSLNKVFSCCTKIRWLWQSIQVVVFHFFEQFHQLFLFVVGNSSSAHLNNLIIQLFRKFRRNIVLPFAATKV